MEPTRAKFKIWSQHAIPELAGVNLGRGSNSGLNNSTEKIFQSVIIDRGMSDHQLIFCTRKVKQAKFNTYNNVFLRSLKHYTVHVFVEELQKVNFPNYERFSCEDAAYIDFLNKLMKVVSEIAPNKKIRVKNNMQE